MYVCVHVCVCVIEYPFWYGLFCSACTCISPVTVFIVGSGSNTSHNFTYVGAVAYIGHVAHGRDVSNAH